MTVVFDDTSGLTGTDDGGGDGNTNNRVVIAAAGLSAATGTQCQLEFRCGTSCPTESGMITSVYFGQGGTAPNFTGTQVQVLFGGAATFNGSAAGVVTSDVFTLGETFDNTKPYTCAFHFKSGSAGHAAIVGNTNATLFFLAGTDNSSATTSAGMSSAATTLFMLEKITITAASGDTLMAQACM